MLEIVSILTSTSIACLPTRRASCVVRPLGFSSYPDVNILVAGNCDERGTREYNPGPRRASRVSCEKTTWLILVLIQLVFRPFLTVKSVRWRWAPMKGAWAQKPERLHTADFRCRWLSQLRYLHLVWPGVTFWPRPFRIRWVPGHESKLECVPNDPNFLSRADCAAHPGRHS